MTIGADRARHAAPVASPRRRRPRSELAVARLFSSCGLLSPRSARRRRRTRHDDGPGPPPLALARRGRPAPGAPGRGPAGRVPARSCGVSAASRPDATPVVVSKSMQHQKFRSEHAARLDSRCARRKTGHGTVKPQSAAFGLCCPRPRATHMCSRLSPRAPHNHASRPPSRPRGTM